MNKTLETINTRLSCRDFGPKKVSLNKLKLICDAGKMAPSALNRQIAFITCIRKKSLINKLKELSIKEINRECFYGASTLIMVHGPKDDKFVYQDCSCILENMFIAANSLKINSCWINQFDELLSSKDGLKIRKKLGIPLDHKIVGTCAIGYSLNPNNLKIKNRKEDFIKIL